MAAPPSKQPQGAHPSFGSSPPTTSAPNTSASSKQQAEPHALPKALGTQKRADPQFGSAPLIRCDVDTGEAVEFFAVATAPFQHSTLSEIHFDRSYSKAIGSPHADSVSALRPLYSAQLRCLCRCRSSRTGAQRPHTSTPGIALPHQRAAGSAHSCTPPGPSNPSRL